MTEQTSSKGWQRHLVTVARILLGLVFFVFGLNGFLNFIPAPPPDQWPEFGRALYNTGYMFPLLKGVETLAGALLLLNRFVPLALALLAPVVINIFAFHLFIVTEGMGMAIVIAVLEVYLAWSYRGAFKPMLAMRNVPG